MHGARRIIIGTSGSPGSLQALRYAAGIARDNEATLVPVLAWTPPGGDLADRRSPSAFLRQVWRDAAWQQLWTALELAWGGIAPAGHRPSRGCSAASLARCSSRRPANRMTCWSSGRPPQWHRRVIGSPVSRTVSVTPGAPSWACPRPSLSTPLATGCGAGHSGTAPSRSATRGDRGGGW